jgi:hypothetical protein
MATFLAAPWRMSFNNSGTMFFHSIKYSPVFSPPHEVISSVTPGMAYVLEGKLMTEVILLEWSGLLMATAIVWQLSKSPAVPTP